MTNRPALARQNPWPIYAVATTSQGRPAMHPISADQLGTTAGTVALLVADLREGGPLERAAQAVARSR